MLTGAAGFIGSAIARTLLERGHDVVGVDAMIPQAHVADAVPPDGVRRVDVRRTVEWRDLFDGVDVVCHQAAMVGAGVATSDLPLYASHNDLGTATLLAAMSAAGVVKLVLASSMVVYGEGRYRCLDHGDQVAVPRPAEALHAGVFDNPCPACGASLEWALVDEAARLDPRSSYAASKVAQEHYASAWARQTGCSGVALRYHNVYGPAMPRDTPYSGVAAMFRSAIGQGRPPRVFEDGAQMRDFVHVEDVARANLLAIESTAGQAGTLATYNVCSGFPISIREVASHVAGRTGPSPTITGDFRIGDVRHIVASPEKAAAGLGFRATIRPEEGLARFAHDPLR